MTPPEFTAVARMLRKRDTSAEKLLWTWLGTAGFLGTSSGDRLRIPFVLDFFCIEAMLNIELDGGQHWSPEQSEQDTARDACLQECGIKVLRFPTTK